MDEMKKYINRTGKQVPFVPFEQYYPTYDSMNKYQKSWYFYWRTEVRQQHYLDTDLSYIFVHLYEILNGLGWATASDGFDQMVRLWIAYRERFPKLDNYLQEWTLDFARFHKLAYNIPEEVKDLIPIQPPLRNMQIEKHSNDKPLKLPLAMIDILCDYSIHGSKFYKSGNQLLMDEVIPRAVALADAALWQNKGKGILALYGPEKKKTQRYYAFRGARYCEADKEVKISVKPYITTPQLRDYINEIVRHTENVLREIYNYPGRLRDIVLDEATASLISSFLKKEYAILKRNDDTDVIREVSLNPEKIDKLRTESAAVREALNVPEEKGLGESLLSNLEVVRALLDNISSEARSFIFDLSASQWKTKADIDNQLLIKEINNNANKYLARELLVFTNDQYVVEDDLRSELKHIFADAPQLINQTQNNPECDVSTSPNSECSYFIEEQLPDVLKDAVAAMSHMHQKALLIILTSESVVEKLQAIADEAMTMPDMLIDEINEIASEYIDDILIDALDDVPYVFEQYAQDLRDAIIKENI